MEKFKVELPKILFGRDSFKEVPTLCRNLGHKVLIITGEASTKRSGALDYLLSSLSQLGKEIRVFTVRPEPSAEDVDRARESAKGSDFIIGIGGGSALDVAKATSALVNEEAPTAHFLFGQAEISRPPIPSIAIPTTAGTGSEVTQVSVLIGEKDGERVKTSIHHPNLLPRYAVLDPNLTLTCPPSLTAASGADALAHCIESFFSLGANSLSDAIAMQGTALIMNNLKRAYEKGDYESREAMLLGSLLGGISLSIAHLGAVHSLAHSLGALKGIPHGIACGIFLPRVLRVNLPAIKEKAEKLANYLGIDPASFVDEVENLLRAINIPKNLGEIGVKEEEVERIVEGCKYSRSLRYNPKPLSKDDLYSLVKSLL